jgi:hypothetical protein
MKVRGSVVLLGIHGERSLQAVLFVSAGFQVAAKLMTLHSSDRFDRPGLAADRGA